MGPALFFATFLAHSAASQSLGISSGDTIYLQSHAGSGNHLDFENQLAQSRWRSRTPLQALVIEKADGGSIQSGDAVFLKTHLGLFVDVQDVGSPVQARWSERGEWQSLVIEKPAGGPIYPGDDVCLLAHTGRHIDVDPEGGVVQARWRDCGLWQRLQVQQDVSGALSNGATVFLKTHLGTHVDVQHESVQSRWDDHGRWQELVVESKIGDSIFAGDAIFLKSHTGRHFDVEGNDVRARWHDQGSLQELIIEKSSAGPVNPGDNIFLKAQSGNYIEVQGDEGGKLRAQWPEKGAWQQFQIELKPFEPSTTFLSKTTTTTSITTYSTTSGSGQCSAVKRDCRSSKCCIDPTLTCYEKNAWWAECRSSCKPGIDPNDLPQYRTPWSCRVVTDVTTTSVTSTSTTSTVTQRSKELDAQFLIQASFGPTRSSVAALGETSYQKWIQDQISLPIESHRVYYRERVNPRVVRDGQFLSRRWSLRSNTLASPSSDRASCLTSPKTFLNEKHCHLRLTTKCAPRHLKRVVFSLNQTNLQRFYKVAQKYVYEVIGLRNRASPCATKSRWERLDCGNVTCSVTPGVSPKDTELITTALEMQEGWLRDIYVSCAAVPAGATVKHESAYFKHVHLNEHNVYDFSPWVGKHPGGRSKITQWVNKGFKLVFPAHHSMDRWNDNANQQHLDYLGRAGDDVDFRNLPVSLQTKALADAFGSTGSKSGYFQVCGSPGESASKFSKGHRMAFVPVKWPRRERVRWTDLQFDPQNNQSRSVRGIDTTKTTVWVMKALHAKDQLRQRMAWALSQIFVVGEVPDYLEYNELWLNYYDIFVRNAFGNFRDVLREVTYSPLMGEYLSYRGNKAYDVGNNYPDENYAREIMQLFTIGLWKLNDDGSHVLDSKGNAVPTYSNEHITNFARVFTGFELQRGRQNIEMMSRRVGNLIDPMLMRATWHDVYPKPDLDGNYLGDGCPSCTDMPPQQFLSKGAKYVFLGYVYGGSDAVLAHKDSELYEALCGGFAVKCTYAVNVQLRQTLKCQESECSMDNPKVVKVASGFYEYIPPSCTHFFFRSNGFQVAVHALGKVSAQTNANTKRHRIAVQWAKEFPTASNCPGTCSVVLNSCVCPASVKVHAVFDQVPSASDLQASLRVGAFAPSTPCTVCGGDVRAYTANGAIDENTVFEHGGRFFRNARSVVHVDGYSFRNPPVFMRGNDRNEKDALADVESLLDHLLYHPNTPVFIARRLIQRLTTSSPVPNYIRDVGEAFRTGSYGGITFSGQYGDLAATVAAVLLHPEARSPENLAAQGALREPLLKIVHFLRSMEYIDTKGRELELWRLEDVIGEAPYKSPTVFNFYRPDYRPPQFPSGLVAPEFQIFSSPKWIGYLNGMMSLITGGWGLSGCGSGFGRPVRGRVCRSLRSSPLGYFKYDKEPNATLAELDLLLTGGRLSSKSIVRKLYETAPVKDKLKAAQKAIIMTPEFNTLGAPQPTGVRVDKPVPPTSTPKSYKAMVLLYLGGGADTFSMLVPFKCGLYDEYVKVRKVVALSPDELQEITTIGQACQKFGIHHKMPFLKDLYDKKQAAFVSNIGSLFEPTTKQQHRSGATERCKGLFSHSDQTQAAHSLDCRGGVGSSYGLGGRVGDELASQYTTSAFSMRGQSTWPQGETTHPSVISSSGSLRFQQYRQMKSVVENITHQQYKNAYSDEFTRQFAKAIDRSESIGTYLGKAVLKTTYRAQSDLDRQLQNVAKLMSVRSNRKAERDLFFVSLGGFDSHKYGDLGPKFETIDQALRKFVTEIQAQGVFESTTLVSQSEFGRTLSSNGVGTDHGWAGNHFVLGGKINGGHVFNDFPKSLLEGNDQDVGRGRLIPKYPWENMMVPIAEWMGVQPSQHISAFPNLANFNSSHILARNTLFTD